MINLDTILSLFSYKRHLFTMIPLPTLDLAYPAPVRSPPSNLTPCTLPGATSGSVETLSRILTHNIQYHHVFNDQGFHNHVAHHILAIYGLGANSRLLEAAYEIQKPHQRPAIAPPGRITRRNYVDHLGDERYFQAYHDYFSKEIISKGFSKTLEEYLFSRKANYAEGADEEGRIQTEMFNRFIGGRFHHLIQLGYGLEFGLPGIAAEGLAMAAVSNAHMSLLVPRSYWDDDLRSTAIGSIMSHISSLVPQMTRTYPTGRSRTGEMSIFNIIARMQKDDSLSCKSLGLSEKATVHEGDLYTILGDIGDKIRKYSEMWSLNIVGSPDVELELDRKIEELAYGMAVIYGFGGWKARDQPFQADFNLMRLVTSSLSIPPICAYSSPQAIQLLLRSYLSASLAMWVSRGRPTIRISGWFMAGVSPTPQEPAASPKPANDTLTPKVVTPNSWLALAQSALEHPVDHVCEIQRALMHWANLFGSRPAGYWAEGEDRLEGIELLDGTVFVRVAGLTANTLGWMREGQEQGEWSHVLLL